MGSTVYRGVLISGCLNRGVPEVSSFQGVEVSSFQGVGIERSTVYRADVLVSGGWTREVHMQVGLDKLFPKFSL